MAQFIDLLIQIAVALFALWIVWVVGVWITRAIARAIIRRRGGG